MTDRATGLSALQGQTRPARQVEESHTGTDSGALLEDSNELAFNGSWSSAQSEACAPHALPAFLHPIIWLPVLGRERTSDRDGISPAAGEAQYRASAFTAGQESPREFFDGSVATGS